MKFDGLTNKGESMKFSNTLILAVAALLLGISYSWAQTKAKAAPDSAAAAAGQKTPAKPSTADILNWIAETMAANHWELALKGSTDSVLIGTDTISVYDGCLVKVQEETRVSSDSNGSVHWIQETIPLDKLDPEQTRIDKDGIFYKVSLGATTAVISASTSTGRGGMYKVTDGWHYTGSALAERLRRAWHDAIVSCGGKSVNPNLY